jgi:phosphoglycerate dehydrogenase-like enzyme
LAFDTTVVYTSRRVVSEVPGVTRVALAELLASSDVVCLAVPVTPETTGLIAAAELAVMRPSAVLVNVSRGAVVDERALAAALASGAIAGAGLDVLAVEPPSPDNPLLAMPNVLVTPHQAGLSPDAWPRIVSLAWANVVSALSGGAIAHRIV